MMLARFRNYLFIFFVLCGCFACRQGQQAGKLQPLYQPEKIAIQFEKGLLLRNGGNFMQGWAVFEQLSKSDSLTAEEIAYAKLNARLCLLLADSVSTVVDLAAGTSLADSVLAELGNAIIITRDGRSAFPLLHSLKASLHRNELSDSFEYFIILWQLGIDHYRISDEMDSAHFYFRQAHEMASDFPELLPHQPRLLAYLTETATIHRDFVSGLTYAEAGLRVSSRAEDSARLLIAKGTLLRRMERQDSAMAYYNHASRIIQKGALLSLKGVMLREQALYYIINDNDTAFYRLMQELEVLPDQYARNDDVSPERLWGYFHYSRGNYRRSTEFYSRALKHFLSRKTPDQVQLSEAIYGLSEQYKLLKEYDKAIEQVYTGMVLLTPLQGTSYSWENVMDSRIAHKQYSFVSYRILAEAHMLKFEEGNGKVTDLEKAGQLYELIDSLMWKNIEAVQEEAMLTFFRVGELTYSGAIKCSFLLYMQTEDPAYLDQAHIYLERQKGMIMYQDILARDDAYFGEVPPEFRERELTIKARLAGLKRMHAYHSPEMTSELMNLNAYMEEMAEAYPHYYRARFNTDIKPFGYFSALTKQLQTGIVQYYLTQDYLYFLVYHGQPQFGRVAVDNKFSDMVKQLRGQLEMPAQDDQAKKSLVAASNYLYAKLLAPLDSLPERIVVVADSYLNSIPFEVLTSDTATNFSRTQFFVKEHVVNYSAGLKIFDLNASEPLVTPARIVTYAFSGGNAALPSLPGAEKELKAISDIFANQEVVSRTAEGVNREKILQDLQESYDLVHLGLHAVSSSSNKLNNRLHCFAGDSRDTTSIYGYEIAPLHINAQTVVIPACQSGSGSIEIGEGTYSLARAFKQAGVTNVVSSLWKLADGSSLAITENLYRGLQQGYTVSYSLAQAKRKYLENADELTAHPHFWAGLVCQGQ